MTGGESIVKDRFPLVDAARGTAIVAMIGYHLCWDLWAFGLLNADLLGDPIWLFARTAIVSSFLFIAGFCSGLHAARATTRRAFDRFAILAGAAGLVSLGTWLVMPEQWVFFGILHHLALATLLTAALRRASITTLVIGGIGVVALGRTVALPDLDAPWLAWIGMATISPNSLDHVPLFPWFGVVLLGMATGRAVRARDATPGILAHPYAPGRLVRGLVWAGRWSLVIYLVHQGPLYGAVWGATRLWGDIGAPSAADERSFMDSCVRSCATTTRSSRSTPPDADVEAGCANMCACTVRDLKGEGLWRPLLNGTLSGAERGAVEASVNACRSGMWSPAGPR